MDKQVLESIAEWENAAGRLIEAAGPHGGREQAVLAWLVDFAQASLGKLSASERTVKAWEAARFAEDGGLIYSPDNLDNTMKRGHKVIDYGIELVPFTESSIFVPMATETMEEFQTTVRTALHAFIERGKCTFPPVSGSYTVYAPRPGPWSTLRFGGEMEATAYFMASQLLSRYGALLRKCKGCSKITLAGRRDKVFCTQACQMADWNRKHKSKNTTQGTKGGKRHATKR